MTLLSLSQTILEISAIQFDPHFVHFDGSFEASQFFPSP